MELGCQILLYLDNRRLIYDMKNTCVLYLNQLTGKNISKFPPLRYKLEINVMDLLDMSPEAGEALLREPLRWQSICSDILFACLSAVTVNSEWSQNVKPTQVTVVVRLLCVPAQLVCPNIPYYNGLASFKGLLTSVSKVESYAYHTVWSCPEECEDNEVILRYIPKTPPKCYLCKSVLFENSGLRRCGEQVTATMKLNDLHSKKFSVVDDMISKLKLGSEYVVHAIMMKKAISIWSLEQISPISTPITSPIPKDIAELYQACKGISWKFVYCLASSIGINVCPLNCFMHLKICLLLSLTSVKANQFTKTPIVHVFAAGYDTGFVAKLMRDAATLAKRSLSMGTSNSSVTDTLLGAFGGICMMPLALHVYNQKQMYSILSSVESGEIITETETVKLQCAVWAQGMDYKKIILFNVANVFGFICRGDYGEYNDEIAEFLLQRAIEPVERSLDEIKALADVTFYMDIVSGIQVSLDSNTEALLKNYFLAARKDRPRGVSVGTMSALVATCATSARLCRRSVANIDDAVLAIWLHASGSSEPRFVPDEYLQTPGDVNILQKIFKQFKVWLADFTGINVQVE